MQARLSRTEPQGAKESFLTLVIVNFTVDTANRLCFTIESNKTSCDGVKNLLRY